MAKHNNDLKDDEVQVLRKLLEGRYISVQTIRQWPQDVVDRFREPLDNFMAALRSWKTTDDSAIRGIPGMRHSRDGMQTLSEQKHTDAEIIRGATRDAFSALQSALLAITAVQNKSPSEGKVDSLTDTGWLAMPRPEIVDLAAAPAPSTLSTR